jgi:ribosome maturation protein Sdo1
MGVAVPAETVVKAAYGCEDSDRVVLETSLPDGNYDFIANLADGNQEALQRLVSKNSGLLRSGNCWKQMLCFLRSRFQMRQA